MSHELTFDEDGTPRLALMCRTSDGGGYVSLRIELDDHTILRQLIDETISKSMSLQRNYH